MELSAFRRSIRAKMLIDAEGMFKLFEQVDVAGTGKLNHAELLDFYRVLQSTFMLDGHDVEALEGIDAVSERPSPSVALRCHVLAVPCAVPFHVWTAR